MLESPMLEAAAVRVDSRRVWISHCRHCNSVGLRSGIVRIYVRSRTAGMMVNIL